MSKAVPILSPREKLFGNKARELLQFVKEKDERYGGEVPLGNIRDDCFTFEIMPETFCLLRINDKWNRVKKNLGNPDIIKEELRDIWGYCLIALIFRDEMDESFKQLEKEIKNETKTGKS